MRRRSPKHELRGFFAGRDGTTHGEAAIVCDSNGTLFDLAPVRAALGSAEHLEAFFERTLHSALTLTTIGAWAPFEEIARTALRTTVAKLELGVDQSSVLKALRELPAFPDAFEATALAGRCTILTNSSEASARELVDRTGLGVETILSCEEVHTYKPATAAYALASERLGDCVLIAAHAWDVAGARSAGLRAIWVDRDEREWPLAGLPVGERAHSLVEAVRLVN